MRRRLQVTTRSYVKLPARSKAIRAISREEGNTVTQIKIPDRIYLQFGDLTMDDNAVNRLNEIAAAPWCTDKVNETDVEYIRAPPPDTTQADCKLGEPMMHGPQPYRWCETHNRLMMACEMAQQPADLGAVTPAYAPFEAGWNAGFQEAQEPDRFPYQNRCEVRFKELFPVTPEQDQGERDLLRALRQQVEDTIAVAKTENDDDGFITAYHFKTGAIHRLLAEARKH